METTSRPFLGQEGCGLSSYVKSLRMRLTVQGPVQFERHFPLSPTFLLGVNSHTF